MPRKSPRRGKSTGRHPTPTERVKVRGTSEPKTIGTRRKRAQSRNIISVNLTELLSPEDFQITTDVRVTGDRLWRLLLRFRRWLVENPRETGHPWGALLTDIRLVAYEEGLRPEGIRFPWIVAPLPYYHPYRRDSELCTEPFNDDDYVLVTSGPDPICTRHYVYDEFGRAKRKKRDEFWLAAALRWVEGWMHARERQLCQLGASGAGSGHSNIPPAPDTHSHEREDPAEGAYLPASAFKKEMGARLRQATSPKRKGKRVRAKTIDRVKCYCVEDVLRWWPDALTKQRE